MSGRNKNVQEWDLTSALPQGATKKKKTENKESNSLLNHVLDITKKLFKEQLGIKLKKRKREWTCGFAAPDFTVLY